MNDLEPSFQILTAVSKAEWHGEHFRLTRKSGAVWLQPGPLEAMRLELDESFEDPTDPGAVWVTRLEDGQTVAVGWPADLEPHALLMLSADDKHSILAGATLRETEAVARQIDSDPLTAVQERQEAVTLVGARCEATEVWAASRAAQWSRALHRRQA